MKVIGIIGASGSGKTTVCNYLNKRSDVKIIDADKIAKELTLYESTYFADVKEKFRDDNIINSDGTLNRKKLAKLIYNNSTALQKLNNITFSHLVPKIIDEINNTSDDIKIVIIDAPLLVEAGLDKECDYIIALDASDELKISRICDRDNINEEIAKSRLNIQKNNEYYINKSDFVIVNSEDTSIEELEDKVEEIIKKIEDLKEE